MKFVDKSVVKALLNRQLLSYFLDRIVKRNLNFYAFYRICLANIVYIRIA